MSKNLIALGAVLLFPLILMAGVYAGIEFSGGGVMVVMLVILLVVRALARRQT
jgi:hypothetical protein